MRATGLAGNGDILPDDIKFPPESVNELNALDKRLQDNQLKHAVVSYISLQLDFLELHVACFGMKHLIKFAIAASAPTIMG